MKIAIAIAAAVLAAPVALALTAFLSGLARSSTELPLLPEDELGT